jgi:hypothetical protein
VLEGGNVPELKDLHDAIAGPDAVPALERDLLPFHEQDAIPEFGLDFPLDLERECGPAVGLLHLPQPVYRREQARGRRHLPD